MKPGTTSALDVPLVTPTRSNPTVNGTRAARLQASVKEACRDQKVSQSQLGWQVPRGPIITSPSPLHSVYGLWCTCVYDTEDAQIALPLAPSLDGDIFGVGKRPVQREVETDGCVRLVFVEE
jgi:hypothetical protein